MPQSVDDDRGGLSTLLIWTIAVATGALVANLYYAQPLLGLIGPEIGVSPDLAGSIVGITQIGYGVGLFFLVSLADIVENRKLVLATLAVTALSLAGIALSHEATSFLVACFLIGLCSTGAQVLVPFVAHLSPPARRGQIVGNVMAGLLAGIMVARPISLFISASFGWRAMFWCAAVLMLVIGAALWALMPRYRPSGGMSYWRILVSMTGLLREHPAVRWRAAYQALMFGAFSLLWTTVPLLLATRFGLNGYQIALFALAGAGGALAAPVAGRLADRGLGGVTTLGAFACVALAFGASIWAAEAVAIVAMAVLAIVIDAATQTTHIVSQRIIFSVPDSIRGRVNALYMTINFIGGAVGSLVATYVYDKAGWTAIAIIGAAIGLLAIGLFIIETRGNARSSALQPRA